ncbi:hypothetical protein EPUS_08469 [Endocarpon pusillum Z07020]|uniref:Uncharacterized protein n=1 Tax=Endocarpon pusillum (strain Z07020 / HMAS-L-300199) TaxID=1263415 RepID=U1I1N5_ENDPU|nr:uncharacterized protein EPUS_08469 [Endocarpon pusillum Z07020]ERF77165.1 hypothetical protein EPUS_08469 [Endocarpon pusillum Z07020]
MSLSSMNCENLVWAGDMPGEVAWTNHVHNLHTFEYKGFRHLAYSHSKLDADGLNTGENTILNSQYEVVAHFKKPDSVEELDPHEFTVIDNGTKIIQLGYIRHPSDWPLVPNGIVREGVVQVVDFATRKVEFEWRALDHVPLCETCLVIPNLDYFHINSAVRDSRGDLFIIAFHTCTIYKISGATGAIVWRLGGWKSDFKMLDGYELRHMHHLQIQDLNEVKLPTALRGRVTNKTHLALSILDNAFNPIFRRPLSANSSSAMVILLDLVAMTGQVIERYTQPDGMFGTIFGSFQFLPKGERFISWGGQRSFSQFTQNNELICRTLLTNQENRI